MTTTDAGEPASSSRAGLGSIQPGTIARVLLTLVLVGFLVYFVGPTTIGATLVKVAVAVGLSAAVFVGFNKLFDLTYDRWSLFCAASGFVAGFVLLAILGGNRALRDFGPDPWLWALLGGAATGVVMFLLSAPRDQLARIPLAVVGFAALGVLLAVAIADAKQPELDWAKLLACTAIGAAIGAGRRLPDLLRGRSVDKALGGVLLGAGVGWVVGAWGGATFASTDADSGTITGGGNLLQALVATVVAFALIGLRVGVGSAPTSTERRRIEQRSRSWIFVTPALLFVAGGLLIPLVRTVVLSLKDANSSEFVRGDNYRDVITSDGFFTAESWNWPDLWHSRLFWIALAALVIGVIIGIANGRVVRRPFEPSPGSTGFIVVAFFVAACLILGTLRGSIVNNLWWVVVVTMISTVAGLAIAVLADRARGENLAKSLIFLPMAISFVGAGVIWNFVYQTKSPSKPQTGLLNAIWVGLGELSNSDWQKWVVAAVLLAAAAGLAFVGWQGAATAQWARVGTSTGIGLVILFLAFMLIGPGLGGYEMRADGEIRAQFVSFVNEGPYNNMWLMVVLIWIQTGFGMVIFSAAIKAVPTEFVEAARIDGATESQTFWRVTLPQILPTIGVVVTTLIVAVMKVYDIVLVMSGGRNQTGVIAFDMIQQIDDQNFGRSATFATLLFVAILPVMIYNIRNMQKAKV